MSSKQTVEQFVTSHGLRKADNSIIFDAEVSFYNGEALHRLPSCIHIITLPESMVVYIDEFLHDGYQQPEIYSTDDFYFTYNDRELKIRGYESQPDFLVSISLLK